MNGSKVPHSGRSKEEASPDWWDGLFAAALA